MNRRALFLCGLRMLWVLSLDAYAQAKENRKKGMQKRDAMSISKKQKEKILELADQGKLSPPSGGAQGVRIRCMSVNYGYRT